MAHSDIATQFELSRTSIDVIVRKAQADYEQEARIARFLALLRQTDDLVRPWPAPNLLDALVPSAMTKTALLRYWEETAQICLRDLMDMVISTETDPRPEYLISPLLDLRCAGVKGLRSTVDHLSDVDLGPRCNAAWDARLGLLARARRIKGARPLAWSKPITRRRQRAPRRRHGEPREEGTPERNFPHVTFAEHSFSECLARHPDLASLRAAYARKPAEDRRLAADWEYHSAIASRVFSEAVAVAGERDLSAPHWPEGVVALAIDPLFAPAILTVGSMEYQLGRRDEALQLLLRLTTPPPDEPELPAIIDKAGVFLTDKGDYEHARDLYAAAESAFPDVALYSEGLGYCLGKLGQYQAALVKAQRVNRLEPDNHEHLNDLGWALYQAGQLRQAEVVLEEAVALAVGAENSVRLDNTGFPSTGKYPPQGRSGRVFLLLEGSQCRL